MELFSAFDHASSSESSEASYEGMYGSDDPDFDMNRARRSNLDELMPVSYSSGARKKLLMSSKKQTEGSTTSSPKLVVLSTGGINFAV